jgi:integrase
LPKIGHKHLDEVKRTNIVAMINAMREQGYAVGTCNRVLILSRYIFNCVRKWGVNKQLENPCQSVSKLQDDIAKERYLTEEEAKHLFEAVCRSDNPMLRYIVPVLILSGARKQEVFKARWVDFDFERRQWRIPKSRNGKHRYVPMSDTLIQVLLSIPGKKNEWVFPNPMTNKPYVNIFNSWNTARKEANLADVRLHDLRHSFASFLVNAGRSLYEVQKILGHTQIKTTQRYAHLSQETLLDATNAVAGILSDAMPVIKPAPSLPVRL